MKKSELRQLIKEELNNFNEAEETSTDESGLDTKINISGLVKKLDGVDVSKFNAAFKMLQQDKPLGNIQNKAMADTFIALMKNNDEALATQFRAAFKKIK
jgi:outer membrane protein assembly factor BamD (BamD/ComL family)